MRTANQPLARRPAIGAEITGYFDRFQSAFGHALAGAVKRGEVEKVVDPAIASALAFGVAYAVSAVASEGGFDRHAEQLIAAGRCRDRGGMTRPAVAFYPAPAFSISPTKRPKRYRLSRGPGEASGWYCTENTGRSFSRKPQFDPSNRET